MTWSIERRLPLLVTTLLVLGAVAQLTIGYGEVRQSARAFADERLRFVDSVLVELLMSGQQRARLAAVVHDSAVITFLRSGGRRGREQALEALRRVTSDTATNARLELRDFSGRLLLSSGRFALADSLIAGPGTDSARIGPLLQRDTVLYFGIAAATPPSAAERGGGIVQQVARVGLNERTRRTLTGLSGGELTFLLGNASGNPWTDFASIVPAPPQSVLTSSAPTRYERGELKRALARAVRGTPWMVVTEVPSRLIRAPAQAYIGGMFPVALLVVVLGALGAWWGSRRITTPLAEVTTTAEAIAGGDLERRVGVRGDDELGRLARSFNTMAEQVSRSHHHLESQVAERTRALERTNAELESFSYSVSHDLRAPLRAIHGFARILLEDHNAQLDPEAQRLLGVIDQNTRRMGQLIDDLLAFSRLGRQEISTRTVDMQELTRAVVDEVQRAEAEFGRQGSLQIQVGALPKARGDRALLRQVMSNLIQNAAKFTRGRTDARIEVGAQGNGTQTAYFVKDNGAGFDPRFTDKLFGVFQRLHTDDQFDGTGVGLAIVKRIVQRHGGRVWAEGQLNQGATFYFTVAGEET